MLFRKNYKKNFLLTTIAASVLSLSIPMNSVFALTSPLIIDARIKSPTYGILKVTIEKPEKSKINIETDSCKIKLNTSSESFWPLEDLNKVAKRYPQTRFIPRSNGLGSEMNFPCGSTISIKEDGANIYVDINTHLKPIIKEEKQNSNESTNLSKLRPMLRPDNLITDIDTSKSIKTMEEAISSIEENTQKTDNNLLNEEVNISKQVEENIEVASKDDEEKTGNLTGEISSETILTEDSSIPTTADTSQTELTSAIPNEEAGANNTVEEIVEQILPRALNFYKYKDEDFIETKNKLTELYANDLKNNYNPNPTLIEFAQLYLSKQMGYEGLSILSGIDIENINEDDLLTAKSMQDTLEIIENDKFTFSDEKIIGNEMFSDWVDYPVWTALAYAKNKEWDKTRDLIDSASQRIADYPEEINKVIIPTLLEAAVETGKWSAAKNISIEWDKIPNSIDTPAFQFLIGQAALKSNKVTEAFDAFSKASLGNDLYAHRAKMAIVDLGISTDTMPLQDAKVFLEEIRYNWRGDVWELEALKRLVSVHIGLGDEMSALLTLGDAIRRFPEESEQEKMIEQAYNLIDSVYEKGKTGELPIDTFFDNHKILKNSFGYLPNYNKYVEQYADKLVNIGATLAAVNEYKDLQENLSLLSEFNIESVEKERIENLKLKEAEAQIKGARYLEAKEALDKFNEEDAPNLLDKFHTLESVVLNYLGDKQNSIESGEKTETYDAIKTTADNHYENENWENAFNYYERVRNNFPDKFNSATALKLIISAYKNNDDASVLEILSSYPELMENEEWIKIGEELTESPSDISKLNKNNTQERVRSSDLTLEKIDNIINN